MQLTQHTDLIWTVANFSTPLEYDQRIGFSDSPGDEKATVGFSDEARMAKGLRSNFCPEVTDLTLERRLWVQVETFVPTEIDGVRAVGLSECFRFYCYGDGQKSKRHVHGRFRRDNSEESRVTFMIYLNDNFEGGEMAFDTIAIAPQAGMVLSFVSKPMHEGCPVTSGFKYVLRSDVMYRSEEKL